ncbi:MAG: DUF4349 domain-containing protein [Pseudoxanthomonas suwonensis]|nr:DUF4349 domain-containing protein [Pseudoxanthomonas suwonensis]
MSKRAMGRSWTAGLALLALAACSGGSDSAQAPEAGTMDAAMIESAHDAADAAAGGNSGDAALGATLAYEHSAQVKIAPALIPERVQQVRTACEEARFGQCVVLTVEQQGGDWPRASLGMRMVPEAVEPTVAMATDGVELGSRSSRAEDLAVAIRDNDLVRERLGRERDQLLAFQQRRDLAVADMIALSRQLAEVEAQLQASDQTAAQQQRRIRTQLLTISFQPTSGQSSRNDVLQALGDAGATLSSGLAWTIRAVAFLLPLIVLLGAVLWWRRRRRRRAG